MAECEDSFVGDERAILELEVHESVGKGRLSQTPHAPVVDKVRLLDDKRLQARTLLYNTKHTKMLLCLCACMIEIRAMTDQCCASRRIEWWCGSSRGLRGRSCSRGFAARRAWDRTRFWPIATRTSRARDTCRPAGAQSEQRWAQVRVARSHLQDIFNNNNNNRK